MDAVKEENERFIICRVNLLVDGPFFAHPFTFAEGMGKPETAETGVGVFIGAVYDNFELEVMEYFVGVYPNFKGGSVNFAHYGGFFPIDAKKGIGIVFKLACVYLW
jgi:hypothetical protein